MQPPQKRRPGRPRISPEEKKKTALAYKRNRKLRELEPILNKAEIIASRVTGNANVTFDIPKEFPFIGKLKLMNTLFDQMYVMSTRS